MVKMTQATRGEVLQLEVAFDALLGSHQARATAICHVREKFFLQVFGASSSFKLIAWHAVVVGLFAI